MTRVKKIAHATYETPDAQLDQMNEALGHIEPRPWQRDRPQKPKVGAKDPTASNYWSIMPTDEMHK